MSSMMRMSDERRLAWNWGSVPCSMAWMKRFMNCSHESMRIWVSLSLLLASAQMAWSR